MKLMKNTTLLTISKIIAIAIGDRKAMIAVAISDHFSNDDRDLKFYQDRDHNHNFRDRGHALKVNTANFNIESYLNKIDEMFK